MARPAGRINMCKVVIKTVGIGRKLSVTLAKNICIYPLTQQLCKCWALVCVARRLIRIQDIHANAFHFPAIDADEAKVHIILPCYNC